MNKKIGSIIASNFNKEKIMINPVVVIAAIIKRDKKSEDV